jgi:uncharacterized membrane protein YkvA (DUF1232 family)
MPPPHFGKLKRCAPDGLLDCSSRSEAGSQPSQRADVTLRIRITTQTKERTLPPEKERAAHPIKPDTMKGWLRRSMSYFFQDIVFLFRLLRHPDTPWYAKSFLFLPLMYICSPIQLIPNFIPVLGQMDDLLVAWIARKLVRKLVDQSTWQECRDAAATTRFPFSWQLANVERR